MQASTFRRNPPAKRLNSAQLQTAAATENRHFALIRKKYPELKIYFVLSLASGQTRVGSSPREILREFTTSVVNDAAKSIFRKRNVTATANIVISN